MTLFDMYPIFKYTDYFTHELYGRNDDVEINHDDDKCVITLLNYLQKEQKLRFKR